MFDWMSMDRSQITRGFGYGVVATIAMSIPMLFGFLSGMSPIPESVPKAIVASVLGIAGPKPLVVGLAVGLHLAYGGAFGALLAAMSHPVTVSKGVGLGVALWLLMQLVVLPVLGWGVFGTTITPRIAVVTLLLHLVYGVVLGWTLDRRPVSGGRPTSTGAD